MSNLPEAGHFVIVEGQICRNSKGQPEFKKVILQGGEFTVYNSGKEVDRIANEMSREQRGKVFFILDAVAFASDRGSR